MAMAGVEVFGLAVNVMTIVETVIKLLVALQRAQERQQDLPKVLQKYRRELQNTREIVEVILSEDALHIATIMSDLNNIDDCGNSLKHELIKMSKERNPFQQYTYQLLKGSKDATRLSDIMNGLNLSKDSLVLKIQVVHVGLTKAYRNAMDSMSSLVGQTPIVGPLRLAEFPKNGKVQTGENWVCIDFTNLKPKEICGEPDTTLARGEKRNSKQESRSVITRAVIRNKVKNTAFMLNGPVGEEPAEHLEIRENEASDQGFMLNYGTKWRDIKRLKRMQQGDLEASDSGSEDDSDEEYRRRRKTGKSPRRTLPRRNKYPQPSGH